MIKISRLADYGFLILCCLGEETQRQWSASSLAERSQIALPTVSKILKILNDAQLVTSVRGVNGGYMIAKRPEKISLAEVIVAVDGNIALTECCQVNKNCIHDQYCHTRSPWQVINRALHQVLNQYTLADLYPGKDKLLERSHV